MDINEYLYKDDFDLMFHRQSWHGFSYKSLYNDPDVLRLRWIDPPNSGKKYSPHAFFDRFGDNTFRKLLRAIFSESCTYEKLISICSRQKLDDHLSFMNEQEIIVQNGELLSKAPQYQHIKGLGHTLEWYVAEWFRTSLKAPARHGVTVKEVADGGDLDVVAFVDGLRIMVECKSGKPTNITETQLRLFLQRADEFSPEIAILLLDTESDIAGQIEIMNKISRNGDLLSPQNKQSSLYWGFRCVYVVNAKDSIEASLYSVLRLYHTKIKHLSFWG
jgi:hypothetical protein